MVTVGAIIATITAIIKLVQFVKAFGFNFSMAQVILVIEIVINPSKSFLPATPPLTPLF